MLQAPETNANPYKYWRKSQSGRVLLGRHCRLHPTKDTRIPCSDLLSTGYRVLSTEYCFYFSKNIPTIGDFLKVPRTALRSSENREQRTVFHHLPTIPQKQAFDTTLAPVFATDEHGL